MYCLPPLCHAEEHSKEADNSTECLLSEGSTAGLPQAAGNSSTGEKGSTLQEGDSCLVDSEEVIGSTQGLGTESAALESFANGKQADTASSHSEVIYEPANLVTEDTTPLIVPSTPPQSHSEHDMVHATPGELRPRASSHYMDVLSMVHVCV